MSTGRLPSSYWDQAKQVRTPVLGLISVIINGAMPFRGQQTENIVNQVKNVIGQK